MYLLKRINDLYSAEHGLCIRLLSHRLSRCLHDDNSRSIDVTIP